MTIEIAFDSFEEMMKYLYRLKKGTLLELADADTGVKPSQGAQQEKAEEAPPAGEMSVPYGRQIAPNFPNANVSQQAVSAIPNALQPVSTQSAVPGTQPVAPVTQPAAPSVVPTTPHEYKGRNK